MKGGLSNGKSVLSERIGNNYLTKKEKSAPSSRDTGADFPLAIHVVLLGHCFVIYRNVLSDEQRFLLVQQSF